MARQIPFDRLTEQNYTLLTSLNIPKRDLEIAYLQFYSQIGLIHGKRVGRGINKELKDFDAGLFESTFNRGLMDWLFTNIGSRITTVHESFIEAIQKIILEGINEGKSISKIATELEKLIGRRSFYRWQSLRIARTEATAAANRAAYVAGQTSGVLMEKVWISATDNRTRRVPRDKFDHLHMNGVAVGQTENFVVRGKQGNELMLYPGDPKGSAGNVIQCRCTVGFRPKRDGNGRIIRIR